MPLFNLNPKTTTLDHIFGNITFPHDSTLANLSALYNRIKFLSVTEYLQNSWNTESETEHDLYVMKTIRKYGGLAELNKLLNFGNFKKYEISAATEGIIAGLVLCKAIQLDGANISVSKEKLFKIVGEFLNHPKILKDRHGNKIPIKTSRNRLYDCWKKYACVAPWWLAIDILQSNEEDSLGQIHPYSWDALPAMTAIAGAVIEAGSHIKTRSQSGKPRVFYDPDIAMIIPPEILEDFPGVVVNFKLPPFTPWEISFMADNDWI